MYKEYATQKRWAIILKFFYVPLEDIYRKFLLIKIKTEENITQRNQSQALKQNNIGVKNILKNKKSKKRM